MPNCPTCGDTGRKVQRGTLESLLRSECRNNLTDEQHYVCSRPNCDTVYFCQSDGWTFVKSDLVVRFGLKETESPRPVCYCFDHTVEEIEAEIRRTDESTVVERIKADMKGPGCRCAYTNPLGGCCLNTVQAAVEEGFRVAGREKAAVGADDHADCCAGDDPISKENAMSDCCSTSRQDTNQAGSTEADCCQEMVASPPAMSGGDRTGALAAGGSVAAAILSSACCWLPLLLITFGVSVAGVAGFFEAYRPYFILGAVGLLGFGYYMVYIRKEQYEPGSACATPNRRLKTFNQVMLWTATALVSVFVFFPNYVGLVLGSPGQSSTTIDATGLNSAEYRIEGMTCEACAVNLRNNLAKLPGVITTNVDYLTRTAVVRYDPAKPVSPEEIIEVVKAAGYQVQPNGESP